MMNRIIFLLMAILVIISTISCSRGSKEPFLNLIYDGRTYTTLMTQYKDNNTEKKLQGEKATDWLKVKQGSNLQLNSSRTPEKCTLLVQREDNLEQIEKVSLEDNKVDTSIAHGRYIYTFTIEWKEGSAEFIKFIEIE